MRKMITSAVIAFATISLAGCVGPEETINEGVTLGAGNAVAHNSALQIIDPWPPGVQDTDLVVPAERESSDTSAVGTDVTAQPAL